MNLDKVTLKEGTSINTEITRFQWTREQGYDIVATPVGVLVRRTDAVKDAPRGEHASFLIPFLLIGDPMPVSKEQPKK